MIAKLFVSIYIICALGMMGSSARPNLGISTSLYQVQGVGRPLYVRSLQGIDGLQSNLFEIFMEPYGWELRPLAAVAMLTSYDADESTTTVGELVFTQQNPPTGHVLIRGNITGLTQGQHGLHIHETGDLRKGCDNIGDHFNPYLLQHGSPRNHLRHIGDLGNIEAKSDGTAEVNISEGLLSLAGGVRGIMGRAIAVTANEDDFGTKGTADSVTSGNSGKVVACGIIGYIR